MAVTDKSDYEDDLLEDIQEYEYQEMFEKANNVVLGFVASTTATGAVPIPVADAPLLIGQQVAMMTAINSIFEFDIERDALTSLATAAIGVGGATVIGKTVASNLLKRESLPWHWGKPTLKSVRQSKWGNWIKAI